MLPFLLCSSVKFHYKFCWLVIYNAVKLVVLGGLFKIFSFAVNGQTELNKCKSRPSWDKTIKALLSLKSFRLFSIIKYNSFFSNKMNYFISILLKLSLMGFFVNLVDFFFPIFFFKCQNLNYCLRLKNWEIQIKIMLASLCKSEWWKDTSFHVLIITNFTFLPTTNLNIVIEECSLWGLRIHLPAMQKKLDVLLLC